MSLFWKIMICCPFWWSAVCVLKGETCPLKHRQEGLVGHSLALFHSVCCGTGDQTRKVAIVVKNKPEEQEIVLFLIKFFCSTLSTCWTIKTTAASLIICVYQHTWKNQSKVPFLTNITKFLITFPILPFSFCFRIQNCTKLSRFWRGISFRKSAEKKNMNFSERKTEL